MIKYSKALLEVWDWKEKIFDERKGMSISDRAEILRKNSQELLKKYNIKKTTSSADAAAEKASGY